MKYSILHMVLGLLATGAGAQQTPREVLQKARENCLAITNGRYTLERQFVFVTKDSMFEEGLVVFEKQPADSLFGMIMWAENNTDSFGYYYNGEHMHTLRHIKRTVTIDTVKQNMLKIFNGSMVPAFINYSFAKTPMTVLDDTTVSITYAPHHRVNADTAIILAEYPEKDGYKYWTNWHIDKNTWYPVMRESFVMFEGDTQYEGLKIKSYSFNLKQHSDWLRQRNWPDNYDTLYQHPTRKSKPLLKDVAAPNWQAVTNTGDSIEFSKLDSRLYLLDFWYMGCSPCIKAMPFLQAMHAKYGGQGLQVIGLNPYDYESKGTKRMEGFLQKTSITYTVGFIDKKVASDYNVGSYPTMYLVDNTGKIIHSQLGYAGTVDAEIEKIIAEYLNKN